MCQNCDFQKLVQGLHENFLNLRFRDNHFELVRQFFSLFFVWFINIFEAYNTIYKKGTKNEWVVHVHG